MMPSRKCIAVLGASFALLIASSGSAGLAIEDLCSSQKLSATAQYSRCALAAEALGIERSEPADATQCVDRMNREFERAELTAEARGGLCLTTGDAPSIADRLADTVREVGDRLTDTGGSLCQPGIPGVLGATLELEAVEPSNVTGTFQEAGVGLFFQAGRLEGRGLLLVETLAAQELIRLDSLDGDFVRGRLLDGAVEFVPDASGGLEITGDLEGTWTTLLAMPEFVLLPKLSKALGQFGVNGRIFPATFPLHLFAMSVFEILGLVQPEACEEPVDVSYFVIDRISGRRLQIGSRGALLDSVLENNCDHLEQFLLTPPDGITQEQLDEIEEIWVLTCTGSCEQAGHITPDRANGCFGMCGPGCQCWTSICGDCCVHAECVAHDRITGNCGLSPSDLGFCVLSATEGIKQLFTAECDQSPPVLE